MLCSVCQFSLPVDIREVSSLTFDLQMQAAPCVALLLRFLDFMQSMYSIYTVFEDYCSAVLFSISSLYLSVLAYFTLLMTFCPCFSFSFYVHFLSLYVKCAALLVWKAEFVSLTGSIITRETRVASAPQRSLTSGEKNGYSCLTLAGRFVCLVSHSVELFRNYHFSIIALCTCAIVTQHQVSAAWYERKNPPPVVSSLDAAGVKLQPELTHIHTIFLRVFIKGLLLCSAFESWNSRRR